ncbi:MAG: prolipoprotein diacylglyceryl transferase [Bacillota bacterium]
MYPFLHIGDITLPMYGIMITIGIFAGLLVAILRAKINGIAKEDILYAFLYGLIGVFAGAKLLYILPRLSWMVQNKYHFLEDLYSLLVGGFVFYGGLIGGLLLLIIYIRSYKIPMWPLFDSIIPSIPLIHAMGRVGCFFAGCCYGIPAAPPWGVLFNNSLIAPHGIYLLPVQLIEAAINVVIFIFIVFYSRQKRKEGNILGIYLLCYAIQRFFLEFLRFDFMERGMLGILSTSQWISLIMIPIGVLLIILPSKYLQLPAFILKNTKNKDKGNFINR